MYFNLEKFNFPLIVNAMNPPDEFGKVKAIVRGTTGQLLMFGFAKYAMNHSTLESIEYLWRMPYGDVIRMCEAFDAAIRKN